MENNITTRPMEKTIEYWKTNAEEDYLTTPISVLRYISELEKRNADLITDIDHRLSVIEDYASGEAGVEITKLRELLNEIAAGKHKNGIEL